MKNILQDDANPLRRIVDLIPSGSVVLDIGTGSGILAQLLAYQGKVITIDGIEPNHHAGKIAKSHYRDFYVGIVQDFINEIRFNQYDFVVLADVLEHMPDPDLFLKDLYKHTSPACKILATIPNVAFGALRLSLLRGRFKYTSSGLVERTHLRFFTASSVEQLFSQAKWHISILNRLERSIFSSEIPLRTGLLEIIALPYLLRDPLARTYQFLVVVEKKQSKIKQAAFTNFTRTQLLKDFIKYLLRKFSNG